MCSPRSRLASTARRATSASASDCSEVPLSSAVRFSLGLGNDATQVDRVVEVLAAVVGRLRAFSVF